jgi:hypothetical protein
MTLSPSVFPILAILDRVSLMHLFRLGGAERGVLMRVTLMRPRSCGRVANCLVAAVRWRTRGFD